MGVQKSKIRTFLGIPNCGIMSISFKYLGMYVGDNPRKLKFRQSVINKIKTRLRKWEGMQLSYARRVCLIKCVITTFSLYYMPLFKVPICVCEEIVRIQRKFLQGWGTKDRKIAQVQWRKLCREKEEDGAVIKDIKLFNIALLRKWKWILGKKK